MSNRSLRLAGWLAGHSIGQGDRVLLVLGNCVPLWELTLACIRLGAVIIPATTLLSADDLRDRVQRGEARAVVAHGADAPKFAGIADECLRIAVDGDAPAGGRQYPSLDGRSVAPWDGATDTLADDPLLLYCTSGTTAQPKLVEHSHTSYPVGHLSTMYWIGLQPGDVHLNISSPGWAKHAWSNVFAPWNAGATILIVNQTRFAAAGLLDAI